MRPSGIRGAHVELYGASDRLIGRVRRLVKARFISPMRTFMVVCTGELPRHVFPGSRQSGRRRVPDAIDRTRRGRSCRLSRSPYRTDRTAGPGPSPATPWTAVQTVIATTFRWPQIAHTRTHSDHLVQGRRRAPARAEPHGRASAKPPDVMTTVEPKSTMKLTKRPSRPKLRLQRQWVHDPGRITTLRRAKRCLGHGRPRNARKMISDHLNSRRS
jgi:hypothetical protein